MLALELVEDPGSRRPATELARRTTEIARERGLMLLTCGLYSNVLRVLVPILAEAGEVEEGLEILEDALVEAAGVT
jgi:4-aminobutyrate aminotransferase/(S)-3-amino-2-methylpropionate transaminase